MNMLDKIINKKKIMVVFVLAAISLIFLNKSGLNLSFNIEIIKTGLFSLINISFILLIKPVCGALSK